MLSKGKKRHKDKASDLIPNKTWFGIRQGIYNNYGSYVRGDDGKKNRQHARTVGQVNRWKLRNNQEETLEIKNTVTEIKDAGEFISSADNAKDRVSKLSEGSTKTSQTEIQREKNN